MIWCVEDDPSIREIVVYALRSTGLEAHGFEDGTTASGSAMVVPAADSLEHISNAEVLFVLDQQKSRMQELR